MRVIRNHRRGRSYLDGVARSSVLPFTYSATSLSLLATNSASNKKYINRRHRLPGRFHYLLEYSEQKENGRGIEYVTKTDSNEISVSQDATTPFPLKHKNSVFEKPSRERESSGDTPLNPITNENKFHINKTLHRHDGFINKEKPNSRHNNERMSGSDWKASDQKGFSGSSEGTTPESGFSEVLNVLGKKLENHNFPVQEPSERASESNRSDKKNDSIYSFDKGNDEIMIPGSTSQRKISLKLPLEGIKLTSTNTETISTEERKNNGSRMLYSLSSEQYLDVSGIDDTLNSERSKQLKRNKTQENIGKPIIKSSKRDSIPPRDNFRVDLPIIRKNSDSHRTTQQEERSNRVTTLTRRTIIKKSDMVIEKNVSNNRLQRYYLAQTGIRIYK